MSHAIRPRRGRIDRSRQPRRDPEPLEPRLVMATFTVNSFADVLNPPAGTVTLRSAIVAANDTPGPNTINLPAAGTYRLDSLQQTSAPNSGGALTYTGLSNLTVENTSGGIVTVVGNGQAGDSVFDIDPTNSTKSLTVTFQGLTITGGGGGGILAQGAARVVLNGVILTGNQSQNDGGGIDLVGSSASPGSLTVNSSQITSNASGEYGGGIASDGADPVTINQSVIVGNVAEFGGGGILVDEGSLAATGSTIGENTAFATTPALEVEGGGGIDDAGAGPVTLNGDIVEDNVSDGDGGGYDDGGSGRADLSISNSFFLSNTARGDGGGIATSGPTVAIKDSTLQGNGASGPSAAGGGGLYIGPGPLSGRTTSLVNVSGSTIADNWSTGIGGGIDAGTSSFALANSTIEGNRAYGNGGGLDVADDTAVASAFNSLFLDNSSGVEGGGLDQEDSSMLELGEDQFTGNIASGPGGAITFSNAPGGPANALQIFDTTFSTNLAGSSGGALNLRLDFANATLTNDTFTGNAAGSYQISGSGGAIVYSGGNPTDTLTLLNDTINNNSATNHGGGFSQESQGRLVVENTILAQNTANGVPSDDFNQGGTVVDVGGNLISSTSGTNGNFSGDTYAGSIDLGPLLDNGGNDGQVSGFDDAGAPSSQQVIQTEALLPGSPAFGHGVVTSNDPTTDDRGFPRPLAGAGRPASGAYEPQYARNATPNQVFVENVYEVFLGQVAEPAGLAAGTAFLNGGGSPTALVQALQGTIPYLRNEVFALYKRYLDRSPTANEITVVGTSLEAGTTPEQIAAELIGSSEFASDYGGAPEEVFVEAAFGAVLSRPTSSQAELTAWDGALNAGYSRQAIGGVLLATDEYITDLTVDDFAAYLGRDPSPADLTAFLASAKAGESSTEVAAIALGASFALRV